MKQTPILMMGPIHKKQTQTPKIFISNVTGKNPFAHSNENATIGASKKFQRIFVAMREIFGDGMNF